MVGPDLENKPKEKNDGNFGKDKKQKQKNNPLILGHFHRLADYTLVKCDFINKV